MKKFFKVFVYIILVIIFINYFSNLYSCKRAESPYINKNGNFDVLFIGGSGVIRSISPLQMYENYGISSYVVGSFWSKIPLNYYYLQECLETQKPRAVFIEVESFSEDEKQTLDSLHYAIDYLPLTKNKLDLINSDAYNMSAMDKFYFIAPFFRFHSKWTEYNRIIQKPRRIAVKPGKTEGYDWYGYVVSTTINTSINSNYMEQETNDPKDEWKNNFSEEYLLKIKDVCDKNYIKLILFVSPYTGWSNSRKDDIKNWSRDHNITLIDCNDKQDLIKIDYSKDFGDKSHMNIKGSEKVTNYLANYLKNNYDLADHRNDNDNQEWNENLAKYKAKQIDWEREYNTNLENINKGQNNEKSN